MFISKKINYMEITKNAKGPDLIVRKNHYKAIDTLICSKTLHSRLEFESKLISSENVGKFYKYVNGKISSNLKTLTLKSADGNLVSDPLLKS